MSLAQSILKALCVLKAQIKYKLFNTGSIIIFNLNLKDEVVIDHPVKGIVYINHFLYDLHQNLTKDIIYPLISDDGVQYQLLEAIKSSEDQKSFTEEFLTNHKTNPPKYLMALHPFKKTFFHKHIIVVGA